MLESKIRPAAKNSREMKSLTHPRGRSPCRRSNPDTFAAFCVLARPAERRFCDDAMADQPFPRKTVTAGGIVALSDQPTQRESARNRTCFYGQASAQSVFKVSCEASS